MSTLLDLHSDRPSPEVAASSAVQKPRFHWWSRVLIPAGILLTGATLFVLSAWDTLIPVPEVSVEAAIVKAVDQSRPASTQVQAAGWLEASPYLRHVSGLTSGVLEEVLVLEGTAVEKGQVVARMVDEDAELAVAQAEALLALRRAAVEEAKARHAAAEASWQNPVALEREAAVYAARKNEAVATVAAARARVQEQEARLAQISRNARRAEKLMESDTISKQLAEESQNRELVAKSTLAAAKKVLQKAEAEAERIAVQERAAKRDLDLRIVDRRELDMAGAALKRAQAEVKLAEVELAEAKLRLSRMTIVSTIDGIVVKRFKEPGDKVMLGGEQARAATILSVYNPKELQARVDVPLADAANIAIGQRCHVVSEVLPQKRFTGRVDRILHAADVQKNTLEVKVVLDSPSPALRPEMLCRVLFLAEPSKRDPAKPTEASAVFAPKDAIRDGRLWVLNDYDGQYGHAKAVPAEITNEHDGWVAVDGLNPGDQIISQSSTKLKQGQRVRVAKEAR